MAFTYPIPTDFSKSLSDGTYIFTFHNVKDFSVVPDMNTPTHLSIIGNDLDIVSVEKRIDAKELIVTLKGSIIALNVLIEGLKSIIKVNNPESTVTVEGVLNSPIIDIMIVVVVGIVLVVVLKLVSGRKLKTV